MSLMKTYSNGHSGKVEAPAPGVAPVGAPTGAADSADQLRRRAKSMAKLQQAAERITGTAGKLARGVSTASAAVDEMRASVQQIAAGAAQGARSAQQGLTAVTQVAKSVGSQRALATSNLSQTEEMRAQVIALGADIEKLVVNVGIGSERQSASVVALQELQKRADDIGEIVKAVAGIADQTNLLALNAAIEAARAKQYGKGFAVVADEVRALAENSEKSARDIQDLVRKIQGEVKIIAEGINVSAASAKTEVEKGRSITAQLEDIRGELDTIISGARDLSDAISSAEQAISDARDSVEVIAQSAQEQAGSAETATRMAEQQTFVLQQSEQTAQGLAEMAEDLKGSSDITKSAAEVASAAEELSTAIQEITRSSEAIATGVGQISRGAAQQSTATRQASAAAAQIEAQAQRATELSRSTVARSQRMLSLLGTNRLAVEEMINGLTTALADGERSQQQVKSLEVVSRRIDKIIDAIVNVSIQTSMLAVNGSIEAARAGDYGKGFVVVSTDIRNLAQESSQNAERIKDLVKSVQEQIGTVRRDLEDIAAAARGEVAKAAVINTGLGQATAVVEALLGGNQQIARESKDIAGAVIGVRQAIDEIAAAAEEASRSSAESAQVAEQQSRGAAELARITEELAALTDELRSGA